MIFGLFAIQGVLDSKFCAPPYFLKKLILKALGEHPANQTAVAARCSSPLLLSCWP
jgi:hypothetical protein